MTYESFFALLAGLLPTVGAIIAIVNWMQSRFEKLSHRIESVQHMQAIKDTEIEGRLDTFELRINGNKESISHKADRLQENDRALHARLTEEVQRINSQIEQFRGYLEKQGFQTRDRV